MRGQLKTNLMTLEIPERKLPGNLTDLVNIAHRAFHQKAIARLDAVLGSGE